MTIAACGWVFHFFKKGGEKKQTSSTFVGKTEAYLQFLDCEMAGGNCKCAYGCGKGKNC